MGPFTLFASPMLVSLVATIEKPQFEGRTRIIAPPFLYLPHLLVSAIARRSTAKPPRRGALHSRPHRSVHRSPHRPLAHPGLFPSPEASNSVSYGDLTIARCSKLRRQTPTANPSPPPSTTRPPPPPAALRCWIQVKQITNRSNPAFTFPLFLLALICLYFLIVVSS